MLVKVDRCCHQLCTHLSTIFVKYHDLNPQGSDSGPFGTGCVNMFFSNDPF